MILRPEYGAEVARKYQADAALLVSGWCYCPYGSLACLKAQGLGVWHLGKVGQVQCYACTMLEDRQGRLWALMLATRADSEFPTWRFMRTLPKTR